MKTLDRLVTQQNLDALGRKFTEARLPWVAKTSPTVKAGIMLNTIVSTLALAGVATILYKSVIKPKVKAFLDSPEVNEVEGKIEKGLDRVEKATVKAVKDTKKTIDKAVAENEL